MADKVYNLFRPEGPVSVLFHDNGDGTYSLVASLGAGSVSIGSVSVSSIAAGSNNIGKVDPNIATPTAYNLTLTNANTEYSQAMPANCRGFEFQCRTAFDCRFAFVTGKVATPVAPYMTLKSGYVYSSPDLSQGASPSTLYFASATAGVVIEIIAWV